MATTEGYNGAYTGQQIDAAIGKINDAVTVSGGGTMQMGESLGEGPYTIEVTEDGEGGDLSAEQVGYSNTGSGLEATNVQGAIDELAGRGSSGVITFNGRSGAVVPQEGDYTAISLSRRRWPMNGLSIWITKTAPVALTGRWSRQSRSWPSAG